MKTRSLFITLLASLVLSHANASPADERKLAAANNSFAFKLLKQIAADEPVQNIFISPYSASAALQMVANGAAGQTKSEMQNVLGTSATGLADVALNQASKDVSQSLLGGNPDVTLEIANAIWCRKDAAIKPDFLACNREYFGATIAPLDFADPGSVDVINQWASDKTHGHISRFIDSVNPENARLVLANAVYFKGKWADPFDPGTTYSESFHLGDGTQKTIRMMGKYATFSYRRGTGYQAVRLPYRGGNLAMYVFLPDINSRPEKLLDLLTDDTWRQVTKPGFTNEFGDLRLPKFKLDYSVELMPPLQKLGMKAAFDPDKADFSGISPEPLYISEALQKTFVEVKEEGTEAAAVTGIHMDTLGLPERPPTDFEMIVNRPFLFLIEDDTTGTILFMGIIYDPPADE